MPDILDQIRLAVDGDTVAAKNIALRKANDEIVRMREVATINRHRAEAAEARLKAAEDVIRPFAKVKTADGVNGGSFLRIPDGHGMIFNGLGDEAEVVVTIGHLRAAAKWMAEAHAIRALAEQEVKP